MVGAGRHLVRDYPLNSLVGADVNDRLPTGLADAVACRLYLQQSLPVVLAPDFGPRSLFLIKCDGDGRHQARVSVLPSTSTSRSRPPRWRPVAGLSTDRSAARSSGIAEAGVRGLAGGGSNGVSCCCPLRRIRKLTSLPDAA